MMCRSRRRSIVRRRGAAAIEYAIVLPVLLMFVLGIIDTGRLLWTYATISRAAEAAARCAAISAAVPTAVTCATVAATKNYAVAASWGLNVAVSAFSVSNPACGMQVQASYAFDSIMFRMVAPPWKTIQLTATSCYPFKPPA